MNSKFINFVSDSDTGTAEMRVYGTIQRESGWYDDTSNTVLNEFLDELKGITGDSLTVRINSGGGDVFVANAIYSALRDSGKKITCKIDGWAASAATIIAMAADEIMIPENGVFMIHNPKVGVMDYVESKECTAMAARLDTIKNAIVAGYAARTGKESEEIANLMDSETWWTGSEAVENGFCDSIMFEKTEEIENAGRLFVNKVEMDVDGKNVPDKIKQLFTAQVKKPVLNKNKKNQGGKNMEIENAQEMAQQYPQFYDEIRNEAIQAERKRIKDIQDAALPGYENLVAQAINDGKTAGDLAMAIIAKQKEATNSKKVDTEKDVIDSKVNDVAGAVTPPNNKADEFNSILDAVLPSKK